MADQWHYMHEGRPMQPVSTAEIERLARAGLIKRTDMVWCAGRAEWLPAGEVPQVFAPSAALGQAPAAAGPSPLVTPRDGSANQAGVQLEEPILLELPEETAQAGLVAGASRPRRRRWDGKGEPDIALRVPRRDRHQQMVVLWIGLFIGGGLLLVVFLMGLLYIALGAL